MIPSTIRCVWCFLEEKDVTDVCGQSHYFDQVINRYKHIISGQFYGHSHQDQFGIAYSDYSNRNVNTAVSNAWIVSAITPRSKFDPPPPYLQS